MGVIEEIFPGFKGLIQTAIHNKGILKKRDIWWLLPFLIDDS